MSDCLAHLLSGDGSEETTSVIVSSETRRETPGIDCACDTTGWPFLIDNPLGKFESLSPPEVVEVLSPHSFTGGLSTRWRLVGIWEINVAEGPCFRGFGRSEAASPLVAR